MIRQSIMVMIEEKLSPYSIVAAHGMIVTPDEAEYLREYKVKLNQLKEGNAKKD